MCSLNICLTLFDVTIEFLLGGLVVAYGYFHVKFSLVYVGGWGCAITSTATHTPTQGGVNTQTERTQLRGSPSIAGIALLQQLTL